MNNYKYLKINFSQGKEISRIGSNSISSKDYSNQIRSTNYYVGSWFGALLYCIGEYIIAIPRREGNGWKCYGPGNDNPEEVQTFLPPDSGGSNFNWPAWYLFYQPSYANYLNNPQNGDPWLPYSGGYYDPNNPTAFTPPPASVDPNNPNAPQSPISWFESIYDRSEYDFETGDNENDFVVGNEDNHIYSEYQGNEGWPTIQNVIPKTDFVGWNNRLHPDWQCMQYAIAQIAKKNKYISQYFASNQTIQIYKTSTGANANAAKVAVRYLMTSLQNGDPVIVGVDDEDGSPNMLTDQTTDHFIVIVGMGTNAKGTYFTFYDNASGDPTQGASDDNKLYYKEAEGKITGKSKTAYANRNNRREYVVTQIRKNKK